MNNSLFSPAPRPAFRRAGIAALVLLGLSACAAPPPAPADQPNDPLEPVNRATHTFNKGLDRVALRPASQVYGHAVPGRLRQGVSNFASNLGVPSTVLNNILQGKIQDAGRNTFRFLVNTTFGLGGFLDPASDMGLYEDDSDFGETLYVWGVGEGPYVELPFFGPSTSRAAVGRVVDFATNPLGDAFQSPEREATTGTKVLSLVGDRYDYTDQVDGLLYDSADSYSQARLLYLQNRRYEIGSTSEADAYDPYEDPYADPQ